MRESRRSEAARKAPGGSRRAARSRGGALAEARRNAREQRTAVGERAGSDLGRHVPVLAAELTGLLSPSPGETVVDCTFGGGGHARLVAERLGSDGTLIAIDRDPLAEERFLALASELSCAVRFIRGDYAEALQLLAGEGVRADGVYFDLGMSSMQVDT
ncbi:MAG: 16S rRNA (cytosine(1402)-N(4))-methyltransferase, partial [Solirubrobacteraceae bacterium]